jgi:hypothetical protein
MCSCILTRLIAYHIPLNPILHLIWPELTLSKLHQSGRRRRTEGNRVRAFELHTLHCLTTARPTVRGKIAWTCKYVKWNTVPYQFSLTGLPYDEYVRFRILKEERMTKIVFWGAALCSVAETCRHYFPSEESRATGFIALKIHRPRPGLNKRTLGRQAR